MAYSTPLDPSVPGDNEFARLGASRIRNLAQAVKERLLTLVTDIDTDPLELKDGSIPLSKIKHTVHEYTYPAGFSSIAVGGHIEASTPDTSPVGTPILAFWKTSGLTAAQKGGLILNAWHDGVNANWTVRNAGDGSVDLGNSVINIVSIALT
jgi:hypothetical protein